jgi:hypothetical protein
MIVKNRGTGQAGPRQDEDGGPIGIFPTWSWVYGTVLVYGALVILVLWVLSRVLDPGS